MYLAEGNLVIRNATADDARLLCEWWNDGRVMAHAGYPRGLHTTVQRVKAELATEADEDHRRLMLEIDSVPIGEMSYRRKDDAAEIGIKICDFGFQDKGHGTLALKLLIECLFHKMGYARIVLDTNENNARSRHVYEGLGFRQVGVRRRPAVEGTSEPRIYIDYELARKDFAGK